MSLSRKDFQQISSSGRDNGICRKDCEVPERVASKNYKDERQEKFFASLGSTVHTAFSEIDVAGKNVIIIGGGDTGADCLGTAHRQGAASIKQFEIMPHPPMERSTATPWPTFPLVYKVTSAHEEGGERVYAVNTTEFIGEDGVLTGLRGNEVEQVMVDGRPSFQPVAGSEFELPADFVFLAMGFLGPEPGSLIDELGLETDARSNIARDSSWSTNVDGVFSCGDMGRGQSLIVWAIAEGRSVAASVDTYLMGETLLPSPVRPTDRPMQ